MKDNSTTPKTDRREFLGSIAASAAIGITALATPLAAAAEPDQGSELEAWFDTIKGKHKMVFDVTQPHGITPFAWPRVFLTTNGMTGTAEKDCSAVVVLRHTAVPYALASGMWEKYKLGDAVKAEDPATKAPALRNPFEQPKPGEYKAPGIGPIAIGIKELQASGVMFCVCNMALTVWSTNVGTAMNLDPIEIRKEWVANILPGIQIVPSGVWALGRAQERGCGYCFAS